MSERWYWLDWLRVLAMGTIFLFHSSRPFDVYSPWHITNSTPDLGFTLFDSFISGWIMPLFFVISGVAVYFSLSRRSASEFATDRLKRLIVPFIFGLFFILPVNVYYDAVFHGNYAADFGSFYLGPYFTKYFPFSAYFSPTYFADVHQGVYLWYLFWLFVFSIVTVYFFRWLVREGNLNRLSKLHAVCERRGGVLLLAVPVVLVNIAAVPPFFVFPSGFGGWKLPTYLILFVIAYVMATNPRLAEVVEKNRLPALLLGLVTSLLILTVTALTAGQSAAAGGSANGNGVDAYYVVVSTVWALNGWCWVAAILGFGRKHLSFPHKYLKISNELVLPFYVLHQSVIVAVAFYVVSLNLIAIEKYLSVLLASFPIIVALLYPVSKINVIRFLFGMRMKNRSS